MLAALPRPVRHVVSRFIGLRFTADLGSWMFLFGRESLWRLLGGARPLRKAEIALEESAREAV